MKIEILGSGCSNCTKLAKNAEEAVKEAGIDCEIEKVTDFGRIMGYGVMSTPAIVIDGIVKSVGKVPNKEEIKKMILTKWKIRSVDAWKNKRMGYTNL